MQASENVRAMSVPGRGMLARGAITTANSRRAASNGVRFETSNPTMPNAIAHTPRAIVKIRENFSLGSMAILDGDDLSRRIDKGETQAGIKFNTC